MLRIIENIILSSIFLGFGTVASSAQDPLIGDLNTDFSVDITDLVLLNNHLGDTSPLSDDQLLVADIDRDGDVDQDDRLRLKDVLLFRDISGFIPEPGLDPSEVQAPTSLFSARPFVFDFVLQNNGRGILERPFQYRFLLSPSGDLSDPGNLILGSFRFDGQVRPGESVLITQTADAPASPGQYRAIVELDITGEFTFPDEDARFLVSEEFLQVEAPFEATIEVDRATYANGDRVTFQGQLRKPDGSPAAAETVKITLTKEDGHSRVLNALSGLDGRYSMSSQISSNDFGRYSVSASYPEDPAPPEGPSFEVLNLSLEATSDSLELVPGAPATISVAAKNPSNLPLSEVRFRIPSLPPGVNYSIDQPLTSTMASGSEVSLSLTFESSSNQAFTSTVFLVGSSLEGVETAISLDLQITPPSSSLVLLDDQAGKVGLLAGRSKSVTIPVQNLGNLETGPIIVALPPQVGWISSQPLDSVEPGGTAFLNLNLNPPADADLGLFTGRLLLEPQNGTGLSVPFELRILSELTGDLRIRAEDEFTYFAEGRPPLEGATISLSDPYTKENIQTLETGASGEVVFADLSEGQYELSASGPQHETTRQIVEVKSGQENLLTTFLSRQFVSYRWDAQLTEIEDVYRVRVESEFETNVPAPVLVVSPSIIDLSGLGDEAPTRVINFTITNVGLIDTDGLTFGQPSHPDYTFSDVDVPSDGLAAGESIVITMETTWAPGHGQGSGECQGAEAGYAYRCGPLVIRKGVDIPLSGGTACGEELLTEENLIQRIRPPVRRHRPLFEPSSWLRRWGDPYSHVISAPTGGGGPTGSGGGGSSFSPSPIQIGIPPSDCFSLPCPLDILFSCPFPGTPSYPPFLDCPKSVSLINERNYFDGALAVAGCGCDIARITPAIGAPPVAVGCTALDVFGCLKSIYDCRDSLFPGFGLPGLPLGQKSNKSNDTLPAFGEQGYFLEQQLVAFAAIEPLFGEAARRLSDYLGFEVYIFGDGENFHYVHSTAAVQWRSSFWSSVTAGSEQGRQISETEAGHLATLAANQGLEASRLAAIVRRWQVSIDLHDQGILRDADAPNELRGRFIAYEELEQRAMLLTVAEQDSQNLGFKTPFDDFFIAADFARSEFDEGRSGVCARVRMGIDQEAVLTRTVVEASLTLTNNSAETPMDPVGFDLTITDSSGALANDRFSVELIAEEGFEEGGAARSLATRSDGTLRWRIIPLDTAAPTEPVSYRFGGRIEFQQDGNSFTIPVAPVTLEVAPDAALRLDYFHQRDVIADDPHTAFIEASEPFALGVIVTNEGAGVARNLSITSGQPEIVENELGLEIGFTITGTEVDGEAAPRTLRADFGDVNGGEAKVAIWQLESTLQGLFLNYTAEFEHVSGNGDPRLSLIKSVDIHETIRRLDIAGLPAFLVNNIPDPVDLGDTLFFSDGSNQPVAVRNEIQIDSNETSGNRRTVVATVVDEPAEGWFYLRVSDPVGSSHELIEVRRQDGTLLSPSLRAWQSDRTFLGLGRRPRSEDFLHFVDEAGNGPYTFVYEEKDPLGTTPPSSELVIEAVRNGTDVVLSWSSEEAANGQTIVYDVFVSENNGDFIQFLSGTRQTSAVFSGEPGSDYSFYTVARDQAGNVEAPPASGIALPAPLMTNQAPEIDPINDQVVLEGRTLAFQVYARDPDGFGSGVTYALNTNAPGASIDADFGWIQFATSEGEGGVTYPVELVVREIADPSIFSTLVFNLEIFADNQPPRITQPSARSVELGDRLSLSLQATDLDLPPQTLSFSVGEDAPENLTIDTVTGEITWIPNVPFAGQTVEFLATVDDGFASTSVPVLINVIDTRIPEPLEPVEVPSPIDGLTFAFYHGGWNSVPDFSDLTPYKTGYHPEPSHLVRQLPARSYALRFEGFIEVPRDGLYTFYLEQQGLLSLSVGSQSRPLVEINDFEERRFGFSSVLLKAGFHPVSIIYLQDTETVDPSARDLVGLEWEGPSLSRSPIPAEVWHTSFEILRDPNAPLDTDLDGLPDVIEVILGYDASLGDSDGNGVADGFEDFDSDDLPNVLEVRFGLDPSLADSDGNGLTDALDDHDGDTLSTGQEISLTGPGTDPTAFDTDRDGWGDGDELTAGSDPLDQRDTPLTRSVFAGNGAGLLVGEYYQGPHGIVTVPSNPSNNSIQRGIQASPPNPNNNSTQRGIQVHHFGSGDLANPRKIIVEINE